ncbi:MAG: hypothetical protein FWC76_07935 [Defluviitaleaceae bacterium]|nr:hypothetical protein [Defluviitaleaceae bacterium]
MIKIGVLDKDKTDAIGDLLQNLCINIPIELCKPCNPLDILIVNSVPEKGYDSTRLSSKVIIANSDDKQVLELISTIGAQIITYGFNPKAAITASSHIDGAFVICIQRAIITLYGAPMLPSEFAVDFKAYGQADGYVMGTVAAALLCGAKF